MPSREAFIYIPPLVKTAFYLCSLISIAFFISGLYSRFSIWLKGKEDPPDLSSRRLSITGLILLSIRYFFSSECLLAKRVMVKSKARAIMLIFIYWGFTILFIGTVVVGIDHYLKLHILRGPFYLLFSFILDIAGFFVLIGAVFFMLRRLILSKGLVSGWDDLPLLIMMVIIVLSGFTVEGVRLSITRPAIMDLSPFGAILAMVLGKIGIDKEFYIIAWSIHVLSALFFIAIIPFSKQFHMFAAQITTQDALFRERNLERLVHD